MSQWIYNSLPADVILTLKNVLNIHGGLAETLLRNGTDTVERAREFLTPKLDQLKDPFQIAAIDAAVNRLIRAIENHESIAILGDYDVDGVTSTAFLVDILRKFGNNPGYYVPRRLEEGYGLSRTALERVLNDGEFKLFIALDCGTNSTEEIKFLRKQGLDVLVIDHHRARQTDAAGAILVNPHVVSNDTAENAAATIFCTVGLVFKVCHALLKKMREKNDTVAATIDLREYLELVAMGTIADLVPLTDENRLLANFGLRRLKNTKRAGIVALMNVSGLTPGSELSTSDISFRLGPRINASGRLADAVLPVEMLLSNDTDACRMMAEELNTMNRERQEIEKQVTSEVLRQLNDTDLSAPVIVAHGEWHPGVVGIVAGKLTRQFNRPCIVLGREGKWAKGSGRSVPGINLVEALQHSDALLESWGGHPMAVGVMLDAENVAQFRAQFAESVRAILNSGVISEESLNIAAWIDSEDITDAFLDNLEKFQPFGEGNPEPIFGIKKITLKTAPVPFGADNYRFQIMLNNYRRIGVVAWRKANKMPPAGVEISLAFKLGWNHYNGKKYPQAELVDWRDANLSK